MGFMYTDEWYVPIGLASSVGLYETYEEAQKALVKADVTSLKNMGSYDFLRDLTDFYEDRYAETQQKVINYFESMGWFDNYKKAVYGDDASMFYWEASLPWGASHDEIAKILEIIGASFHKILEYKNLKEDVYIKMNYEFWGKKVFEKLKAEKILESRTPYINGTAYKGFYLINNPPEGRKTARFPSIDEAHNFALTVFLECLHEFPENNFLGKTAMGEWSDAHTILMIFLENCKTIAFNVGTITPENKKTILAKLKKVKSLQALKEGDEYYEIEFPTIDKAKPEEILGLINLLKVKPFEIYKVISEIDGQKVANYFSDGGTF
ncbi:hypothetical protein GCM10027442_37960 [Emticicia fontis]